MPEFVFMLTHDDVTVEDAFKVYDEVRDTGLHFIGFKDVGLPFDRLKALTEAMHEDGREVMLEVVSEEKGDELRSAEAALDLGVDYLLGGTHASCAAASRRSRRAPWNWRRWTAWEAWIFWPTATTATWRGWCGRWSRR